LDPDLDADGDGLPNGWEQTYGFSPFSDVGNDGPNGDPDGDGLSNLAELLGGSDPLDAASPGQKRLWVRAKTGTWQTGSKWSVGVPPAAITSAFITNAGIKTVTLDGTTPVANRTVSNLSISASVGSTNTLAVLNTSSSPLNVLNSFTNNLRSA